MTKDHLKLSGPDKTYLENLLSQGTLPAKKFKRATALLALDRGESFKAVSLLVRIRHQTVSTWCKKYHEEGLSFLTDKPRLGRPIQIDGNQRAKITALACSDAPEGYKRWSLRLLADRAVELGYCDQLSHTYAGKLLKKTS